MNGLLRVLGASILWVLASAACSETSRNEPSSQSGSSGAAQGGAADAAGMPGKAGSNQPGGGSGGSMGEPEGGAGTGTGTGGEAEGGGAGAPLTGPYQAKVGKVCPVESTIGVVQLSGFPSPYVQVTLYDRKDPWLGAPELSTATCALHRFVDGGCQSCGAGEVCSLAGECATQPRTIKDAKLLVSTGADEREYSADPQLGGIYSTVDIGDASASYAMKLSWAEVEIELGAMPVGDAALANVMVATEGDYATPGALDASWQAMSTGAFVRSRIPINHHAGGPTFTECVAAESAGSFHADAEMIDPLAVITGLEFQGLEHVFIAAASTPDGCVEFRFGEQIPAFPN